MRNIISIVFALVFSFIHSNCVHSQNIEKLGNKCNEGKQKACEKLIAIGMNTTNETIAKQVISQINDQDALYNLVISASFKEVKLLACRKLKNQSLLATITKEINDEEIIITAIDNIEDQEILTEIALDKNLNENELALKKIDDDEFLYKLVISGKNNIAKLAVNKIQNQEILIQIILNCSNPEICLLALDRIINIKPLVDNITLLDAQIATHLLEKIHDQDKLKEIVFDTKISDIVINTVYIDHVKYRVVDYDTIVSDLKGLAINKISDQNILYDISLNHTSSHIRSFAGKKIKDQDLLYKLALKTNDQELVLSIINQITDEELSRKIITNPKGFNLNQQTISKITNRSILLHIYYNDKKLKDFAECKLITLDPIINQYYHFLDLRLRIKADSVKYDAGYWKNVSYLIDIKRAIDDRWELLIGFSPKQGGISVPLIELSKTHVGVLDFNKLYKLILAPVKNTDDLLILSQKSKLTCLKETAYEIYQLKKGLSERSDLIKDKRDGKEYRTTKIGNQIWMAENLNYDINGSYCYNNDIDNCNLYGRLYDWETANKVCPTGWHLPSDREWKELELFLGIDKSVIDEWGGRGTIEGFLLKANGTHWGNDLYPDYYGFSAMPGGIKFEGNEDFTRLGILGEWWSSTKESIGDAFARGIENPFYTISRAVDKMSYYISVRCIKN